MFATRVEVITTLLDRYHELVEPLSGNGAKGDGDSVPLPPTTYTPTIKELERLLGRLREVDRSRWWHVSERYLRSVTRIRRNVRVERIVKGKGRVVEFFDISEDRYDPRVDDKFVEAGIKWIAQHWGLDTEPMLPRGKDDAKFPWDRGVLLKKTRNAT
jgi:hypothetical protein